MDNDWIIRPGLSEVTSIMSTSSNVGLATENIIQTVSKHDNNLLFCIYWVQEPYLNFITADALAALPPGD